MKDKTPLAATYDPGTLEPKQYRFWRDNNYFDASDTSEKPQFSISMPPPNVTGSLHMGHALTATLEDIMIRFQRMRGCNAMWIPGTDHAGIATQMMVERQLEVEGQTRLELGREAFLERTWAWKEQCHDRITHQHEKLGISCDWKRERFTLDEGLSRAVREVFVRLWEDGLIYRAQRLVNWSPVLQTVLSDLEVDPVEEDCELWYVAYPVKGSDEVMVVATTRPETLLGDAAVAVNSADPRYRHLVGKMVTVPLIERDVPVIADDELVDMAFGTGCVKVTPAHDFNDFEVGRRHDLPVIPILDDHARLNDEVPPRYRGLDRFEARRRVLADLEAAQLLVQTVPHKKVVGRSQRSGEVVEPMLSTQWFVKAAPLAAEAIRVVEEGEVRIVPERWTRTYFHWMRNIRDWCISRQLWWGHRIPAWYCLDCEAITVSRTDVTACGQCGSAQVRQDDDVLDTWFSSALWPFSTLGWPDDTKALDTFYPNSVLETGHDILFFWVARMIMMGCRFMGRPPFHTVYLHAMVLDAHGKKMSKTTGNVIDPLEAIATYGADSLRFTLASMTVAGRSMKLSMDRVAGYRNFANKLWNAERFVLMNWRPDGLDADTPIQGESDADRWILTRLADTSIRVDDLLENLEFGAAAKALYQFVWHELCDWYIEVAKIQLKGAGGRATQLVLLRVLDGALRLLHPFMPHITEALWQQLPTTNGAPVALITAPFLLDDLARYPAETARFEVARDIVGAIRTIRGYNRIPSRRQLVVRVSAESARNRAEAESGRTWITRLVARRGSPAPHWFVSN